MINFKCWRKIRNREQIDREIRDWEQIDREIRDWETDEYHIEKPKVNIHV